MPVLRGGSSAGGLNNGFTIRRAWDQQCPIGRAYSQLLNSELPSNPLATPGTVKVTAFFYRA